jgi:pimeloyl-ACP methyl ester carboxylesterase
MQTAVLQHQQTATNGIQLHVVTAGPQDGPLVLLLHGFPEFWYGWRHQIPQLAAAGLRVWAPDLRGYGDSNKPPAIADYNVDTLAADVVGLIDAAGCERACIVGHDWGGVLAWWLGMHHAPRVDRLAILNAPHPAVMRATVRRSPSQWLRSSYMAFFQLPWLPEALASAWHWRSVEQAMQRSSRPGTFSPDDLARYREAWARPGAFTTMLNWYRALVHAPPRESFEVRVARPALLVWGVEDAFLQITMARESAAWCDDGRLELLEAGHWVQHEEAARVDALLAQFLAQAAREPPAG